MGPVMLRVLASWTLVAGSLSSQSFYLSYDAVPARQTVQLTIDPSRDTFEGSVSISIDLREPTSVIWLNAKNLVITQAIVQAGHVGVGTRKVLTSGERIGIDVGQPLTGPWTLRLTYQGRLDDKRLCQ